MEKLTGDPFSDNIIYGIPEQVRESFSNNQMNALISSLQKERSRGKHIIDARFLIPLYFVRFYVVFIFGKDKRKKVQKTITERRQSTSSLTSLFFSGLLVINGTILLSMLVLFLIYIVNALLGMEISSHNPIVDLFNRQ